MILLRRLFAVAFATILCIAVFAALFEFLNAIGMYLSHPPGPSAEDVLSLDSLRWGLMFRAPGYVYFGTVPLLLIFLIAEWQSTRAMWVYVAIWAMAGLLATTTQSFGVARAIASVLAGSVSGCVYWTLAGRYAGHALRRRAPRAIGNRLTLLNYVSYAVLGYLAYQLSGYVYYAGKLAWVTYVLHPGAGTPPFQVVGKRELTASQKVAIMDFPDVESCLKKAASDVPIPERLKMMDWEQIENDDEADVCMFRLLGSYESLSFATGWFEAQGFEVQEQFSSLHPYIEPDGRKKVAVSYSIHKNGPKFPVRGVVRRMFRSIPYSMTISATWSEDGKRLIGVRTSYNTL